MLFICSFHLNCPTTEEQITDRQVLLGVTQKVSSNSKHTLLCLCGQMRTDTLVGGEMLLYGHFSRHKCSSPRKTGNRSLLDAH